MYYSKKIKTMNLPFRTTCDESLNSNYSNIPDSLIEKYSEGMARIYGKVHENNNYVAILYLLPADIILPFIQTNDKKGNKISTLNLFSEYCGGDESSWGTSWATIDKDLNICLTDSTVMFDLDSNSNIIKSSIETMVNRKKYRIDNKGKIIKQK